jgi:hypothetical protein
VVAVDAADLPGQLALIASTPAPGPSISLPFSSSSTGCTPNIGWVAQPGLIRARGQGEHDAAGFGLPPGIDDRAALFADHLEVPFPGFGVDRLADAAQQAQACARGALQRPEPSRISARRAVGAV